VTPPPYPTSDEGSIPFTRSKLAQAPPGHTHPGQQRIRIEQRMRHAHGPQATPFPVSESKDQARRQEPFGCAQPG
jgi:hypothetical protein